MIDPSVKIPSTKIVPPQNLEWLKMALQKQNPMPGLPKDMTNMIADKTEWHFPHDFALASRLKLMEERKYFVEQNTKERFEREFSLCEH